MKESSRIQASHVNSGTSIFGEKHGSSRGREFRHGKLYAELEASEACPHGGLSLAVLLSRFLRLPQELDKKLEVLQQHRPYTDSDHVLTHAYNLFLGGSCLEDIAYLQKSEAGKRMLGTKHVPDPTTAGDFLRRFNAKNINALNSVLDDCHQKVWRKTYGRKRRKQVCIDIDSHVKHIYGNQKDGADFTYKGGYGYHPLALTLGESGEVLRLLNRWGNVTSVDGAGALLDEVFPLLKNNFSKVIVRGDSAFAVQQVFEVCEEHDQFLAIVAPEHQNFPALAESLSDKDWEPFRVRKQHSKHKKKSRKRRKNLRRKKARARGKRDLKLQSQWLAELPYTPKNSKEEYRLIIRKQKIEESNQGELFEVYRYRYVLTNLPKSYSMHQVVRLTYHRCDQENLIEQLQNGISAMRMPTGNFNANATFLVCSRLAHNMKAWLAMLALPTEVMRWEWKRFRMAFVYFSVRVIHKARQTIVRIADSHRFAPQILTGISKLQV